SSVVMPPIPEPTRTPNRVLSIRSTGSAASSTAITAQAMAYLRNGSNLRSSFLSMYLSDSKPLTSPAIRVANPVGSKRVLGRMPDVPGSKAAQNSSAVFPMGVTAPTPVMTTRRGLSTRTPLPRLLAFLDVGDGVADRHDLLGVLVGDLEVELLLERHHQLHGIE